MCVSTEIYIDLLVVLERVALFYLSVWQGLFYRVVGGEISPFRLVRLSPEELLSREMSDWRKSEISEVKQVENCLFKLR